MKRILLYLAFVFVALFTQAKPANALLSQPAAFDGFYAASEAFQFSWSKDANGQPVLRWKIAPGYYLYKKQLAFGGLPASLQPVLPSAESHRDENFGDTEIYRDVLEIKLASSASGTVKVRWQGCADAGLCYPPQHQEVKLGISQVTPRTSPLAEDQRLAAGLESTGLAFSMLMFFGFGLLLAFTPCTLPMLPIVASLVVGDGAGPKRGAVLAGAYVLSMALVYAALGVLVALGAGAAQSTTNIQAWLQSPWLLGSFAALFALLSLPMFGYFELQLPQFVRDRLEAAASGRRGGGVLASAILGALSGLMIGPCMTAPLAGTLLYIAQSGKMVEGGLVLFALGLGIGVPLVVAATFGSKFLPKPGPWMNVVKGAFGFLLLGTAWYLARPVFSGPWWVALGGSIAMLAGYAVFDLTRTAAQHRAPLSALASACVLWGGLMLVGAAGGAEDPWRPLSRFVTSWQEGKAAGHAAIASVRSTTDLDRQLEEARAAGQWVLLDYYADWCTSCRDMEREVFEQSKVVQALDGVRKVRLDVTDDAQASRDLLGRYAVPGPPTMLWIGPDGLERRKMRITGEVNAAEFLLNWKGVRDAG